MKKYLFAVLSLIILLACSCQSGPVVWDDSTSEGSMATVQFVSMNINSFNGISVTKFNWVKIPAGEATLGGDVTIHHAGVDFRLPEMEFTWKFNAGMEYVIRGSTQDMVWGVSVYEAAKYSQVSAENKLAFVPFKNQP